MIIDTLRNMLPANGRTKMLTRAFALAMLFAAVLGVAFALQSGSPVHAQTSTTLVSNTGQSAYGAKALSSDYAQGFSTGSNVGGYKLTSVGIYLKVGGTAPQPTYSVYIARDSSGKPGATLGTLNTSTSLTNSWAVVKFTATGDGINLDADSTYWVVLDSKAANNGSQIRVTQSANEDSGGAAGWSLADVALASHWYETAWVNSEDNVGLNYPMVAVNGLPILNVPVTGLMQSSNNDGYDRCATIVMEWNDPGHTDFTGYKVVVTHPDKTTTNLTADNLAAQANTGAIVLVRVPSATESQTYKIDVYSYRPGAVGKTASRTVTVPRCAKPGAPRSLRITENGPSSIELTWTAPSNAATVGVHEYVLEQLRDGFTDWDTEAEHISTRPSDSDSFRFSAPSMRAGDTRQYRLSAMRYVGFPTHAYPGYAYPENPLDHTLRIRSNPSNTVSFTHLTAPASPWLTAETDGDGVALLTWEAPTEDGGTRVTSYQLQRSKVAGETMPDPEDDSGWTNLSAPSSGQFRHTGLTAGDTWHYRMRARNSEDWSSWFYAQVTIPEGGLPNAPRLTTRFSGTAVDLSWTEPTGIGLDTENSDGTTTNTREDCNGGSSWTASDRGNFICYYELRMEEDGGGWSTSSTTTALCATPDGLRTCEVVRDQRNSHRPTLLRITIDETSHSYQRLNPGASYKFRVRAVTALVDQHESRFGAWSNVRTVNVSRGPSILDDRTGEVIPVTPNEPTISFTEKANNAGSDATIRWSLPIAYTGSVSYRLQWENPATGNWQTLTNTSATSYTHRNLSPSTRYSYRVAIRYGSGVGPYSRSASGFTPGVAFPPDAPRGVRVTSINTTGFNVAWDRSPSASKYTPATNRYVYGLCKWGKEKRTIILDPNKGPEEVEVNVIKCDASQSTTGTTARITTEPGDKIFGVAAVNARGQSDWTTVYVSVPASATKRLTVSRTSLTLTEGDYDRGGSYTVRLVNADAADSERLLIDSGYDRNAIITWKCSHGSHDHDCMLTSANNHTVTVTVYAMWDGDTNDGVVVFHNEIDDLNGPSVRVSVRDRVNMPPVISGSKTVSIAENWTGVLGTYTFTDNDDGLGEHGISPDSDLYRIIGFQGDDLRLVSPLDFEKRSTYEIKLYARDLFNTTIHTVTVTVTDDPND